MKNLEKVEIASKLLLAELEKAIINGHNYSDQIILNMNLLKTEIAKADRELGKALNSLERSTRIRK